LFGNKFIVYLIEQVIRTSYIYHTLISKVTQLKKIKFSRKEKKLFFNLRKNYRLIKLYREKEYKDKEDKGIINMIKCQMFSLHNS